MCYSIFFFQAFASAEFIPENDSQYLTVEKLFKRAALSYSNLAENCLLSKQFGKCLESCGNSLRCLGRLTNFKLVVKYKYIHCNNQVDNYGCTYMVTSSMNVYLW